MLVSSRYNSFRKFEKFPIFSSLVSHEKVFVSLYFFSSMKFSVVFFTPTCSQKLRALPSTISYLPIIVPNNIKIELKIKNTCINNMRRNVFIRNFIQILRCQRFRLLFQKIARVLSKLGNFLAYPKI